MNYNRCEDDGFIIRGKAISKLELMRCNSEWNEDFDKVLDVAIEALKGGTEDDAESATTTDCISRRDALKPFCITSDGTRIPEVDCDNFPVEFSVKDIKRHLLSLPTVTPQVSEDCISRGHIKNMIGTYFSNRGDFGSPECFWIMEAIKNAPSVVPTERTGEWITEKRDPQDVYEHTHCSECNAYWSSPTLVDSFNYCPKCGADMRDDKND